MDDYDAIIVGGGLAGLHTALELIRRGRTVCVYEGDAADRASAVAAGALNPVTGRRLALTWRIDALLEGALQSYARLERETETRWVNRMPIRRYFLDEAEVEMHRRRTGEPGYERYLGPAEPPGASGLPVDDTRGSFVIDGGGTVDLPAFLEAARDRIRASGSRLAGRFDHGALDRTGGGLRHGDARSGCAVFCEGAAVARNPWFGWLPVRPVKGEILRVTHPSLEMPRVLCHHRKWLLPLGDGSFRVGSTYTKGATDPGPTPGGRRELLDAVSGFVNCAGDFEVIDHQAGLRPGSRDFRPYAGRHPADPRLLVVNGLGSKGALIAPWLSAHLVTHMIEGTPVDPEIDCRRYAPRSG